MAALPGAWCEGVRARAGWPGVSTLRVDEIASTMCDFVLSVTARTQILPWDTVLLGREATS